MTQTDGFSPTPYAELNGVLAHLLAGARAALNDNFVGLYLQGSFAVGDFTPWSDCDFIVVTHEDLTPRQLAELQALHAHIHPARALLADGAGGFLRPGAGVAALVDQPARSARRAAPRRLGGPRNQRQPAAGLPLLVPRPRLEDPGPLRARQYPGGPL